jgi:hypothetical protein
MTCDVCLGAIPDGEKVEGHTALCAEVARRSAAKAERAAIVAWLRTYGMHWETAAAFIEEGKHLEAVSQKRGAATGKE